VGLLCGDRTSPLRRLLCCIDLTHAVADEAIAIRADLVMAYHPPIFKPVSRLTAQSTGPEAAVFRCIAAGVAIYTCHTALDAADGGTNDVLAEMVGLRKTQPIEYVDTPGVDECKLVTFVPSQSVKKVADALFQAGAGVIGDYCQCSYRTSGQGTFMGGESTNPAVGKKGQLETVDEIRVETVVQNHDLPMVVDALRRTHPYEEVAFDVYPLKSPPTRGIGRAGRLPRAIALGTLARKLKRASCATCVQIVGDAHQKVEWAIILVGSAGTLPLKATSGSGDVIITGEIRHHDALTIARHRCTAIALGHWASERPALTALAKRLKRDLSGVKITLSRADRDPFSLV